MIDRICKPGHFASLIVSGVVLASSSQAAIIAVGGASILVAAPANATLNAYTHPTEVRVWNELQDVALSSSVVADAVAPGTYDEPADLGAYTLSAGLIVDSHYIHFDVPPGASGSVNGFVTFADMIVGVMAIGDSTTIARLDSSDFLSSGTLYDDGLANRGLEIVPNGQSDRFTISPDGKSIAFHFDVSEPGDRMRVLTSTVPEPASIGVLLLGAAATIQRKRKGSKPS